MHVIAARPSLGARAKHAVIMRLPSSTLLGVSRIFLTASPPLPLLAPRKSRWVPHSLLGEEAGQPRRAATILVWLQSKRPCRL